MQEALRTSQELENARNDFELPTYMEALPQLPKNVDIGSHVRK